ncbi:ATPase family associated with various cellular activities (AAA) [Klebsiella pneumoniae]|uniref:CBASS phage resistance system CD-NTase-associated protein Cap6 n=1 Tax=Klebsiella pneumoniae TaxID=573 RepID=UPI000DE5CA61|nr:CBASS phage resistance system CD-NTase-associated protein Cap6 [Klebsiella pneumoniae]QGA59900.1 AAA family ATPase [Klebsiella pneumoniae]SSK55773.1 ATPase family associated with various cellular activities (AAA) [Klebsiella pneumoniae]
MNVKPSLDELFERRINFPDFEPQERLARLVGLDEHKDRLSKILGLLVNPYGIQEWAKKYHPDARAAVDTVLRRPPLVVLAGDVGSGKTELAETIGDAVARQEDIDITLYPLSLATRGQGRVGEMTQLVSAAFDYTIEAADKLKNTNGKARGAVLLLIDEADALAQSRENAQMHHEDRAGVNAFIRGIDRIANQKLPAAVLMCTNRLKALDPAVQRRAAEVLTFSRPNDEQRDYLLRSKLTGLGLNSTAIEELVRLTGPRDTNSPGFTFSDITQRLIPSIILAAYPYSAVSLHSALQVVKKMTPTPAFIDR